MTTQTRTLASYFTRGERADEYDRDCRVTVLTDDAPEWLRDAVQEAHGDEMPDDWRYSHCWHIANLIDENADRLRDEDDADVTIAEIAESLTDIYHADRLRWLSGYMTRYALVDEAIENMGGIDGEETGIMDAIGWAQHAELERMARVLRDAWVENTSDDEDEAGES